MLDNYDTISEISSVSANSLGSINEKNEEDSGEAKEEGKQPAIRVDSPSKLNEFAYNVNDKVNPVYSVASSPRKVDPFSSNFDFHLLEVIDKGVTSIMYKGVNLKTSDAITIKYMEHTKPS